MERALVREGACKTRLICLLTGAVLLLCLDVAFAGRVLNDALVTRPFRHHVWQDVLTQSANAGGEVDFAKLRAHPKRLNEYLEQLASVSPENEPTFFPKPEDKAAYWVNAHNAIALRIILDRYPVSSLAQVQDFESNTRYQVGGRAYTLGQLRTKALAYRKYPLLLFSLTDYSQSAPPLVPTAYEGRTIKMLSEQAMKATMANPNLVAIHRQGTSCVDIKLSPFFQNYEQALFSPAQGSGEDQDAMERHIKPVTLMNWGSFLQPYVPAAVHADLKRPCAQQVHFKPANKTLRQVRLD